MRQRVGDRNILHSRQFPRRLGKCPCARTQRLGVPDRHDLLPGITQLSVLDIIQLGINDPRTDDKHHGHTKLENEQGRARHPGSKTSHQLPAENVQRLYPGK